MRAVNLLPPDLRQSGGRRGTGTGATRLNPVHGVAALGAVVLLAMLGMWASARHDTSVAREAEAAAVARAATAQAQVNQLQPVVALDRRRAERESAVNAAATGRTDWAMVLEAVAGALPGPVGITQLAATTGGSRVAGLQGQGSVHIVGCSDTQPRVATALRALERLPQVDDVALSSTARNGKGATSTACDGVSLDATVGLAATTILDAVQATADATGAAGAADAGAAGPTGTTTASTADPNGGSR
ncbi:MAG: hypothetical protein M0P31_06690 [Solirubrobacteraceae bacterium]|nr:hypothetical protein [Solirubrobacteraceae bacterium]